jgi:hypothetical protein
MGGVIMKKLLGIGYLVIDTLIFISAVILLYRAACGNEPGKKDLSQSQLDLRIAGYIAKLDHDPEDYKTLKALGIAYSEKARSDFKNYTPKAVECLTRAHEMEKTDYETMCYLGSAITMMANTTGNPIKKMTYVNKGTAQMDKAIKKDPDNINIRLIKAFNSKNLPGFLNRSHFAIEDFEYIADLIEKNPDIQQEIRKTFYSNLVELYEEDKDKDNVEHYQKLLNDLD